MENEESIDLQTLLKITKEHKKIIASIVVIPTILAMIISFSLPKTYEATTLVMAKSSTSTSVSAAAGAMAMLGLGGGGATPPTRAYLEMMKSSAVIDPIIEQIDWPAENKENLTAENFAKSVLTIENTKGTDLIEITAKSKKPEEAKFIADSVVDNFRSLMTNLNQSQQSAMVKFLKERIVVAKADLEKAEQNLEIFSQQSKIYIPDEQAKALIEKLTTVDKETSKIKVSNDSNEAKLGTVIQQLQQQNLAITEYNVSDNPSIVKIRDNIIAKQMELVELEQRYTEKHPDVILLKKEIDELNNKLSSEVQQSVASGTNTLNPVHAGLLQQKVQAETELSVGRAGLTSMGKLQQELEKQMSVLSQGTVNYVKLKRDLVTAQEIYGALVKNYEQARIQEAQESMDIQVIDTAKLPKKATGPNKKLITIIGMVIGIIISFGYILVLYNKREK